MDYTEFMRVIEKPYWCTGSPLKWQVNEIGLAHFALGGRVGMFNLCWLMMQRTSPPLTVTAYQQANYSWAIQLAGGTYIKGRSMEHHASVLQLAPFRFLLYEFITRTHRNPMDFPIPGSIPWKTLLQLSTKVELS